MEARSLKKSGINMKLTLKQQAFADYYIEIGNATEAARRAGYKGNNINKIASANLAKPHIKEYIEDRIKKVEDNRIARGNEVLRYLTFIIQTKDMVINGSFISIKLDAQSTKVPGVVNIAIQIYDDIKTEQITVLSRVIEVKEDIIEGVLESKDKITIIEDVDVAILRDCVKIEEINFKLEEVNNAIQRIKKYNAFAFVQGFYTNSGSYQSITFNCWEEREKARVVVQGRVTKVESNTEEKNVNLTAIIIAQLKISKIL